MENRYEARLKADQRGVALYHVVYEHEGFEESAQALFGLVRRAEDVQPGKERFLCLDIEGHRDADGGFDNDMIELQQEFLLGFLGWFVSEIDCPLFKATNPKPQRNDLPSELILKDPSESTDPESA